MEESGKKIISIFIFNLFVRVCSEKLKLKIFEWKNEWKKQFFDSRLEFSLRELYHKKIKFCFLIKRTSPAEKYIIYNI